ncbi:MAG: hypothetical protein R2852_06840 [Bacteroidia bacterium]
MTFKQLILLSTFCSLHILSFGQLNAQCDSVHVYKSEFDKLFQSEYESIQADSVLAIRHCYTTNGCNRTFGLLCWKTKGEYHFKKIQRKKHRIKSTSKLNKNLKLKLIEFYENKLFEHTNELEAKEQVWIDDGPLTFALFKTSNSCWEFKMATSRSEDIRVKWIKEIVALIGN